jgi:hypothetical protein
MSEAVKVIKRGNTGRVLGGVIWFGGWLFTIGFTQLAWWQIILGIVVWPYFLALAVR